MAADTPPRFAPKSKSKLPPQLQAAAAARVAQMAEGLKPSSSGGRFAPKKKGKK